ncbi:MAG: 50S ribosomal protein L5 [Chloroflexi bacterium]|nr:50S ribosomal protein L5 [Chloroflexota bacterium]
MSPEEKSKKDAAEQAKAKQPKGKKPAEARPEKAAAKKEAAPSTEAKKPQAKKEEAAPARIPPPPPRLKERFFKSVVPTMMTEFSYKNPMQVPRLQKIVLNVGLGEAKENAKAIENMQRDLSTIAGQRPVVTKAKMAISAFKIRKGMPIGLMVTLRGNRMYEFLDRLVNASLPRIRDFSGVKTTSFDGRGNYSMGIKEHVIFPEIDYTSVDKIRSLQVTMTISGANDHASRRLLELLGMPFAREKANARKTA